MTVSRPPANGFTLVEILVVMSLLSLIVLGMGSALRTTAQTGERIDSKLLEADRMRVAYAFLQSTVGRTVAQRRQEPGALGQPPYFFEGGPSGMTWIGILPARHGAGGRHYFRLALGQAEGEHGLLLQFTPWNPALMQPDWAQAQARVLVPDVTDLRMQYVNSGVDDARWSVAWESPDSLPDRVLIQLTTATGAWPDLVIPMRTTPSGTAGSGEAVFGGGAR